MTLLPYTYCTLADLQRFMSKQATDAFADHNFDLVADDGVVDDAINYASQEIEAYATQQYSQAGLASCALVNRWCTILAACNLSMTRGNSIPDPWAMEADRIMLLLAKVADGTFKLPGVALRDDMRPTVSNLQVDRRYQQSKIRVEPVTSTDAPTKLKQNKIEDIPANYYP